jgi:glycosyltransferase involved in cell wall biosynthesis
LFIVHHHLRPGGIRRVIELAAPHLVREAPRPITRVVLATGQRADQKWHDHFIQQLPGVPVEVFIEPSFNYLSEQRCSPRHITTQIRRGLEKLLAHANSGNCLVWAHNLGVGRNLLLSRELAFACAAREIPLVAHHHDWWFDNRWARWREMHRFGFRSLAGAAQAVFPPIRKTLHIAINRADADVLTRHFGNRALWLPNLAEPAPLPPAARVRAAHRWLRNRLAHDGAPIWLLPCRTLRRKNIAEALLLTRWLRPEAWLVVTGAASSADEAPYFNTLERAARKHHWRLRLGVLAGDESRKPTVPELLAASEAVLLTSIQEGFGLPYLEAAAAHRPLIARRLHNIAPDLDRFGFRFPQTYDEILIAPELFNWPAERDRQQKNFRAWRATMPAFARARISQPPLFAARHPCAVPFSRLTLSAQLEVLARPIRETWAACLPLNPFLETWRQRAAAGKLRVTPWPRAAKSWLAGEAYARRFFAALVPLPMPSQVRRGTPCAPAEVQSDFIAAKLDAQNLYPLLWNMNA